MSTMPGQMEELNKNNQEFERKEASADNNVKVVISLGVIVMATTDIRGKRKIQRHGLFEQ